jgi:small subunit ribosomal protein S13
MLVIFGVSLEKNKKLVYALPQLYGIGLVRAKQICSELGYSFELRVKNLTEEQKFEIANKIKEEYMLEGNLKEEIKNNIQLYMSNGSIRGFRHKHKLPVRGQRTRTNAKSVRRTQIKL